LSIGESPNLVGAVAGIATPTRSDRRSAVLGAVTAAAALALATAFGLEHLGGYAPCSLCVLERWPWGLALAVGALGFAVGRPRTALLVMALLLAGNAGLSLYHVAVEVGWLAVPATCAAGGDAATIEELRAQLQAARPTCDRVALTWMGLSLAGWNGLASAAAAALALAAGLARPGRLSS
jgi:disulfide bond formation protein DsbB